MSDVTGFWPHLWGLWREGMWWGVRLEAGDSQEPGGDGAQAPIGRLRKFSGGFCL